LAYVFELSTLPMVIADFDLRESATMSLTTVTMSMTTWLGLPPVLNENLMY